LKPHEQEAAFLASSYIRPGDLILVTSTQTQTPGKTYRVLRACADSLFDHVAVVMDSSYCLQVGPPKARLVPLHCFLSIKRFPFIIRPNLTQAQIEEYLHNLKKLIDMPYNFYRGMLVWACTSLYSRFNVITRADKAGDDNPVCTEAILESLPHWSAIRESHGIYMIYSKIGSFSMNDLIMLVDRGVFAHVPLPFPFNNLQANSDYITAATEITRRDAVMLGIDMVKDASFFIQMIKMFRRNRLKKMYIALYTLSKYLDRAKLPGSQLFYGLSFLWPKARL
jgi:hypothetical protein